MSGARNSVQFYHVGGRAPRTGAITCHLQGWTLSGPSVRLKHRHSEMGQAHPHLLLGEDDLFGGPNAYPKSTADGIGEG